MTQEIAPLTPAGPTGQVVPLLPAAGDAAGRGELVAQLAQKLGLPAAATSVFGAPIEQGGVTVIPVARVRYGFGAGSGGEQSTGGGGGGGVIAKPAGYIEISNGTSRFQRIDNPTEILGAVTTMIVASGVSMFLVWRGFSAIYRKK